MNEASESSESAQPAGTRVFSLATLLDTAQLASRIAKQVQPPQTIALTGTLGAGKTQLVRYLAAELGVPPESVTSPTYVLQHTYPGQLKIHHFDFYRIDSAAQVWDLGIDELFEQGCLVIIEWADKFLECLPEDHLTVTISQDSDAVRAATIRASGPRSQALLHRL